MLNENALDVPALTREGHQSLSWYRDEIPCALFHGECLMQHSEGVQRIAGADDQILLAIQLVSHWPVAYIRY